MQTIAWLMCSCGGSTSIAVDDTQSTAVTECACGRVLLWSKSEAGEATGDQSDNPPSSSEDNPPTLGISTGDTVRTGEKLN